MLFFYLVIVIIFGSLLFFHDFVALWYRWKIIQTHNLMPVGSTDLRIPLLEFNILIKEVPLEISINL